MEPQRTLQRAANRQQLHTFDWPHHLALLTLALGAFFSQVGCNLTIKLAVFVPP